MMSCFDRTRTTTFWRASGAANDDLTMSSMSWGTPESFGASAGVRAVHILLEEEAATSENALNCGWECRTKRC